VGRGTQFTTLGEEGGAYFTPGDGPMGSKLAGRGRKEVKRVGRAYSPRVT